MTNWGKEQRLLLRTEQGWKITAVVYTIRVHRRNTQHLTTSQRATYILNLGIIDTSILFQN